MKAFKLEGKYYFEDEFANVHETKELINVLEITTDYDCQMYHGDILYKQYLGNAINSISSPDTKKKYLLQIFDDIDHHSNFKETDVS